MQTTQETAQEQKTDAQYMAEAKERIGEIELNKENEEELKQQQALAIPMTEAMEIVAKHDICRVLSTLLTQQLDAEVSLGYRGIQQEHQKLHEKAQLAHIKINHEFNIAKDLGNG